MNNILRDKKCRICKKKFSPKNSLHVICSYDCLKIDLNNKINKKIDKEKEKFSKHKESLNEIKNKDKEKKTRYYLQVEINRLCRMIDSKYNYPCIDCGRLFKGQVDAAHYHSRGSNSSLSFNLHNIHSARAYCNQYSDKHKTGYYDGLVKRYSLEYAEYVVNKMPLEYNMLNAMDIDIREALKRTRKIIREFDNYSFVDGKEARYFFNKEIGLYN